MAEPANAKPERDVAESPFADDELDESTDLDFFDTNVENNPYGRMYLARLPAYVWQAWAKLDEDAEIKIGRIRQWQDANGNLKLQMLLRSDLAQHQSIPKEYNMDITNHEVNNTFIFSEQDLPSYAVKNKEKAAAIAQGIPAHLLRQQQQKMAEPQPPQERGKRFVPYTRRAIPKKTAITGTVKHEVACVPEQNIETDVYMSSISKEADNAARKTNLVKSGLPPNGLNSNQSLDNFIKTKEKPTKAKKMENKVARWEEQKLLDRIADCFSQYKYWAIKALRGRIPQPEAFIRQTLEKIALLHRSGPYANTWSLKPGYADMILKNRSQPKGEGVAPKLNEDLASDDDDDDDVQMEDVVI
ncbi:transcription initiation factor IIF, beta subunit-domain-containing protein [Lasiosphaeria ovina]|uniref:Transcription initiation factor IIF subunit beta n=1 Tax=Lasiosphaeria ovina TaxID=92902 RepID=A0AAE0JYY8_9PEZI|nr:transcription initiation factor IIF, beta subunit-domain-containing protein [Lasiosphaeria ovina]